MSILREKVIRLAHEKPELQPYLLPLVADSGSRRASAQAQSQKVLRALSKGDQRETWRALGDFIEELMVATEAADMWDIYDDLHKLHNQWF